MSSVQYTTEIGLIDMLRLESPARSEIHRYSEKSQSDSIPEPTTIGRSLVGLQFVPTGGHHWGTGVFCVAKSQIPYRDATFIFRIAYLHFALNWAWNSEMVSDYLIT